MKKIFIYSTLILLSFSVMAQEKFPGFNEIGKGYNVFGEFANSKSINTYNLFDFSKMAKKKNGYNHLLPNRITVDNISDHRIETIEGSSMKEYVSNLSSDMGLSADAFFFKASIKRQFNENSTTSSNTFFYTYMDINTKWRVSIDTRNLDTLINYLTPQFKKDLESLSPESLFRTYGTHFISSAYFGGRIDYSTVSSINSSTNTTDLKTAINAKYKVISGNMNSNKDYSQILTTAKTSTTLNVVGGNSEFTNNINNSEQYNKWAEGIKKSPVLCGFDENSLKPIWFLLKSSKRKKELEDYFNQIILPKYPLPIFFKRDDILDNKSFVKRYKIDIAGFLIKKDCDAGTYLGGDEDGEFKYQINVYSNGKRVKTFETKSGYIDKVWGGKFLTVNQNFEFNVPVNSNSNIKVQWKLTEVDTYTDDEVVDNDSKTHKSPFSPSDLYNFKGDNNVPLWKAELWRDQNCNATLYYQISPISDKSATEFGSNGWYEFEKGNYDKCLYYSKEALKIDNSLWFVHYNVALVYLLRNNPMALEKYKTITNLCGNKATIKAALQDIKDYEVKNGILKNSAPIKMFLESKI